MSIVLVINGPNLGLLGKRQREIYGTKTLVEIVQELKIIAERNNLIIADYQSNVEGELVNYLNQKYEEVFACNKLEKSEIQKQNIAGIIINPAAYTHTSIALRDALEVFKPLHIPIIEVHLSNIYAREEFRHKSYISPIASGVITGLGSYGYTAALGKIIELEKNV